MLIINILNMTNILHHNKFVTIQKAIFVEIMVKIVKCFIIIGIYFSNRNLKKNDNVSEVQIIG